MTLNKFYKLDIILNLTLENNVFLFIYFSNNAMRLKN